MSIRQFVVIAALAAVGCNANVYSFPNISIYTANGDLLTGDTSTSGALAVNGNMRLVDFSAGSGLPPAPDGSRNVVVVQGSAEILNVAINGGNLAHCGYLNDTSSSISGGTAVQNCSAWDFGGTNFFLYNFVTTFVKTIPTGTAVLANNQLYFNLNIAGGVNIFNITAEDVTQASILMVNGTAGSFVVINVNGVVTPLENFKTVLMGGVDQAHVIYNFFETRMLSISNVALEGTIVAPLAALSLTNGFIDGSLFVQSFNGSVSINSNPPFTPPFPTPM